jgi:hypothetical protein
MKMMADIGTPVNKGVTGNTAIDAAEAHIGTIGDALTVFRSLDGKNGTDLEKQVFDLVKSGELRNAVSSDAEFDKAISMMTQGAIANPKVGPEQWFQFVSKARSAGMRSDDDWVYRLGPELITEFGAPAAGTAWSSLYQGIVSGKLTKNAMAEMDAIGAFDENPNLVRRGMHGQVEGLHPPRSAASAMLSLIIRPKASKCFWRRSTPSLKRTRRVRSMTQGERRAKKIC